MLDSYFLGTAFLFGTIIGSFLNVVIYRFHTGRSINGSSHCLSCGKGLRWYELFPVISYLALRGRCHGCGSYIPSRYLVVELLTGGLFLLLYTLQVPWVLLFFYGVLCCVLVLILVYDIYHMIIPDELSLAVFGVAVGIIGWQVWSDPDDWVVRLSLALVSMVLVTSFYFFLWWVSRGRWLGFGDVKLVAPLGLLLTPTTVGSMIILSFWIGAGVSLTLLGVQWLLDRGQHHLPFRVPTITMKSEIPFAPFLIAAFMATFFFHVDVFAFTSDLIAAF